MDNTKLVVGQQVELISGGYSMYGTVVSITPDAIEVSSDWPWFPVLHFDSEGEGKLNEGTADDGRWHIADICPHTHVKDWRNDGGMYCGNCLKDFSSRRA
jgi:hypothetical protein